VGWGLFLSWADMVLSRLVMELTRLVVVVLLLLVVVEGFGARAGAGTKGGGGAWAG
jgi:hypothetical protein